MKINTRTGFELLLVVLLFIVGGLYFRQSNQIDQTQTDLMISQNRGTRTSWYGESTATRAAIVLNSVNNAATLALEDESAANSTQIAHIEATGSQMATEYVVSEHRSTAAVGTAIASDSQAATLVRENYQMEVTNAQMATEIAVAEMRRAEAASAANNAIQQQATSRAEMRTQANQISTQQAAGAIQSTEIAQLQATVEAYTSGSVPINTGQTNDLGLVRFTTSQVELFVPPDYIGINLDEGQQAALTRLRELGSDYSTFANLIEANPDVFVLMAVSPKSDTSAFVDNLNIIRERPPMNLTLANYASTTYDMLPATFAILEQTTVGLNGQAVLRTIIEGSASAVTIRQAQYIFKIDGTFYLLTYSTSTDQFDEKLPLFETSAGTFRVLN